MDQHDGAGILVRVDVPDLKSQTRIVIGKADPVGYAKQAVLEKLSHDWPIDVANNYGFYIPPTGRKKVGRFLDESSPLVEEQSGVITHLELRYKRRDLSVLGLSEKALTKANSKSNMKKLVDHVMSGSIKKIEKLLDSGLDPNFIMEDGNTPLGLACGRQGRSQCISPLIHGGAIIDFRGSAGLTPIHRAAIGGNAQALKTLLSFGASPNYIDGKGTTPLYHAAIMGDDVTVCELLLRNNSIVGNTDIIGWTELHQIAKHGHIHMIDSLLAYAADINAVNKAGNTPLHVAAQHGQLDTAIHLLKRGANPYILNSSNQPPNQSAILCGHHNLAKEIANFMKEDMDPVDPSEGEPAGERWGTGRRGSLGSREKEMSPTSYSSKTLPSSARGKPGAAVGAPKLIKGQSLTNLTQQKTQVPTLSTSPPTKYNITKKAPVVPTGSKRGPKGKSVEEDMELTEGSPRTESSTAPQTRGHRYSTDRKTSPKSLHQSPPPPAAMTGTPPLAKRERLYPVSTPGKKYFVTMNVDPEQEGDLHLTRGMSIDVLYVGKGGFWEGKVGDVTGWFPQHAITAEKTEGWDDQPQQTGKKEKGPEKIPGIKSVTLSRGPKGFGFAMRGIKVVNEGANCKLTPEIPALQYVGRIDKGSSADMSGLQKGDFIIEVNGVNTTKSTHEEVVGIIKQSNSDKLQLKVITPLKKGTVSTSKQPKEESKGSHEEPPLATQELPTYPTGGSSPKQQAWGIHSQENEEEGAKNYTQSPLPQPISMTPPDKKRAIIQALPSSSPKLQTRGSPSASPLLSNVKKSSPLVKHSLHAKDTSSNKREIEALTSNKDPGNISSSRSEELLQREEENYKLMMKEDEEDEEEGLSELAKQLRKASRERYKRTKERDDQLPPPSSPSQIKVPVTNASTSRPPNDNNAASNTSSPKSISSYSTTMKPAQSIHKTESSTVSKPQSPVAPLKHDLLAEPVKDDDDGWEYTETLTTYADVVPPATTSEQNEYKIDTTSQNKSKSLSKREEQAALRVEHLKKGYLSSKQNATTSSPKNQHTRKPSSPKQEQPKQKVSSSPKIKSSPLVSHHQSSHEQSSGSPKTSKQKDASLPKQQQQSPSLLFKEEKYTPSQQTSLKSNHFDEKEPVTSSAATFMPKEPPPIKPKPSVGKEDEDLPSSIAISNTSSTSAAASVASLAKNFSSPKKSRRDSRDKLQYSKKNSSNDTTSGHAQEKSISSLKETSPKEEEPEEPEPEPQPVMSLKDKFEKMAQSKKPPPPGPIKPKPKKQKPAPEPVKPASEPAPKPPAPKPVKQVKPVFEPSKPGPEPIPPEPSETFLPPPVFEEYTDSNRFSIISLEELPIPAELLNDDSLEEDNNDFLPPPPPPPVEDEEMNASFELPPPPLSLAHSSDEEEPEVDMDLPPPLFALPPQFEEDGPTNIMEPEIPAPPFTPTIESFNASESKVASNEDKELPPPVEIKEERDGESTEESKKEADHKHLPPPPENNLLDNIVGELLKLTTGSGSDEDIDSDSDSAGSPPPLPSGPPPDSDEEDNINLQEPFISEALEDAPGNKESNSVIGDSSLELHHEVPLPPPQRDSVFFDDGFDDSAEDFIPPPALEEEEEEDNTFEPPPFIEDTLPPPFDEEDLMDEQLPPPFDDESLPPPFDEDTDLVPPPGPIPVPENDDDDLPPPIFDDETSDNEFSYDLLPPVPMLLDEEDKENDEFLPPPSPPSFPSPPPPPLSSSDALNNHSSTQKEDNVTVTTQVSSTEHNTVAEEDSSAPVSSWSVDRVCSWLTEIGLEMHTDTFRSNEIYGEHLIDLSRDDLKDLGITKVGHIKTLRQKLNERLQS